MSKRAFLKSALGLGGSVLIGGAGFTGLLTMSGCLDTDGENKKQDSGLSSVCTGLSTKDAALVGGVIGAGAYIAHKLDPPKP